MTLQDLLIDKRIVQRNIEHGKLDAAEYQRLLDALPDLSDRVWRKPIQTEEAPVSAPVNAEPPVVVRAAEIAPEPVSTPRLDAAPAFDASF